MGKANVSGASSIVNGRDVIVSMDELDRICAERLTWPPTGWDAAITTNELAAKMGQSPKTIQSKMLALARAGEVRSATHGKDKCYCVEDIVRAMKGGKL